MELRKKRNKWYFVTSVSVIKDSFKNPHTINEQLQHMGWKEEDTCVCVCELTTTCITTENMSIIINASNKNNKTITHLWTQDLWIVWNYIPTKHTFILRPPAESMKLISNLTMRATRIDGFMYLFMTFLQRVLTFNQPGSYLDWMNCLSNCIDNTNWLTSRWNVSEKLLQS